MPASLALAPLAAPLSMLVVAALSLLEPGRAPRRVLRFAPVAGGFGVALAFVAAATVISFGPTTSPALGIDPFSAALRLDALSVTMFALVAFLGAVVMHYSRRYLEGDARHGEFLGLLALTIASVMLLVLSGTLLQLVLMWVTTGLALHRLLLFYPTRTAAIVAARKQRLVARLGDVSLATAALLLIRALGTGEIALIAERAARWSTGETIPSTIALAVALVVIAAAFKSAQFPTQGWLADVMETPTPVSALLHAGILNGGAFLIVRLSRVVLLSPSTMHAMIVFGGCTALLMSVVMVTQPSVKTQLAYSSAAHMGFMLLLCGVGAFPIAILHLVAHSLYKAHAFLSSGSAVEVHRASQVPGFAHEPRFLAIVSAFLLAIVTVAVVGVALDVTIIERPVSVGLAAMLSVSLVQLLGQATTTRAPVAVMAHTIVAALATSLAFFVLEKGASRILADAVPTVALHGASTIALMAIVTFAFAFTATVQLLLPSLARSPRWASLYVHLRNALYTNTWFDRLVGATHRLCRTPLATENIS